MNERLRSLIAECVKVEPSEVTPDKRARDFAHWDSLAQVLMISKIMEEFNVQIPFDKMATIDGVQDFIDIVEG